MKTCADGKCSTKMMKKCRSCGKEGDFDNWRIICTDCGNVLERL